MGQAQDAKLAEIDRNLKAFLKVLPDLIGGHAGEYVLMHHEEIVSYHPSALDAQIAGNQRYGGSDFSIQQVETQPAGLGFYSYAVDPR